MVYLVGAGAGNVGLLTVKAKEILEVADVVIYDRLADEKFLNYAPSAKKIYVGKSAGQHTLTQDEINKLLVDEGTKIKSSCGLRAAILSFSDAAAKRHCTCAKIIWTLK